MDKITIKIDVSRISKDKITSRTFQNKEGQTITVRELTLDVVPLKETKLLKEGDTYQLYKTHFVAEQQTKEEKESKVKSKIIGDGIMFKNKELPKVQNDELDIFGGTSDINPDDIPF